MKKLILIASIFMFGLFDASAQKGKVQTGLAGNPNKAVSRALPDLTFELVPVLVGTGVEKVEGIPGRIMIPINFIVKNIGLTDSKPTAVYAEYSYKGTQRVAYDIRESIIHIQSDPMPLQTIAMGKDVLRKHNFVFKTTPEQAYGKEVKLRLVIVSTGTNNQNEISVTNNISDEITLVINR